MWGALVYVGIGGALGAMSRYAISICAVRLLGTEFPWGTLGANLMGCFLIGFALVLADARFMLSDSARLFFMTGFLGALTTFSTYALDSVQFAKKGLMGVSLINIFANHILGFVLVLIGIWIGGRVILFFGDKQ